MSECEDAISSATADTEMGPPHAPAKKTTTTKKRSRSSKADVESKPAVAAATTKRATLQHKVFIVTHLPRPDDGGFHRTAIATAATIDAARTMVEAEFENEDLSLVEISEIDIKKRHFYDMSMNMKNWPPSEPSDPNEPDLQLFITHDYDQTFFMPSVAVIVANDADDAKSLLEGENALYNIETDPSYELDELEVKRSDHFYILSQGTLRTVVGTE